MMIKISAVVVLYQPGNLVLDNLQRIREQVDELIIVDNASYNNNILNIISHFKTSEKVKIIRLTSNLGIAKALNIGVAESLYQETDWVATFDQDSTIGDDYFASLLYAYDFCLDREKVMIISPRYYNSSSARLTSADGIKSHKIVSDNTTYRYVDFTMTSGNLLKKLLFTKIGLFKEELFIDQVDHDLCLRCINAGYRILEAINVNLTHELGNQTQHKILNLEPVATNHSALRRYYMSRNRIYMYKTYFLSNTKWVVTDIVRFMKDLVVILMFEKNRASKLKMMARGVHHSLIGRYGKYNA